MDFRKIPHLGFKLEANHPKRIAMKHSTLFLFVLLLQACGAGKSEPAAGFQLPAEWTKDFQISVYTGGGMQPKSMDITFTYDSVVYVNKDGDKTDKNAFAMNEGLRKMILKKLGEWNADKIRSVKTEITYDKESSSICFNKETEFCAEEGAAHEINPEDVANYGKSFQFLVGIAAPAQMMK
jgi:hypothetical protein